MKIKFIFPKNYQFSFKIFGLIDYKTAIFDSIYGIILFLAVHIIFNSINLKVYIFIALFFPILLFSLLGVNDENIVDVLKYLLKYFKSQKIILYERKIKNE